jgi:hypothetical protein
MPQQKTPGVFRRGAQLFDDDVLAHFTRRVNKKSSEKQEISRAGFRKWESAPRHLEAERLGGPVVSKLPRNSCTRRSA